jgi:hypothetical protein
MIYWIDVIFNYGIITTLFVASSFSFLLFFIPCFCFLTWLEFGEMVLEKDEIREAKLNSLFRKLF